jgi:purine-binding chemotaxis protein CheW
MQEPGAFSDAGKRAPLDAASQAGKYLIFELGAEEFGVSVMRVKEIMKMQTITAVPKAPHSLRGVINLRGRIVPVISIRRAFGMEDAEYTERTCIVVVQAERGTVAQSVGVIVDGVVEVLLLSAEEIEERPDFGPDATASYVRGIAKSKGKVKILLDIEKVLGDKAAGEKMLQGSDLQLATVGA